ncbi:MAG TPA: signal recognition particle-docking protein FtsY [Acidimicrobiales bacterium]|jgi:fused signal recognition particle receptor|nr:signal recognition particle-docking protein FtsY [Acidimicrobiales bacterium]
MLILLIVLIVLAVFLVASAGYVVTTRRRPPLGRGPQAPRPTGPPPPSQVVETPAPPIEDLSPVVTEAPPAGIEVPPVLVPEPEVEPAAEVDLEVGAPPRFRDRLGRARSLFGGYITSVRSRDKIDETTWEELEEALILADVGATVAATLLDDLRSRVKSEGISNSEQLIESLKLELITMLQGDRELHMAPSGTTVWMFVGVNGVGKTTTIGKIGMRQVAAGHKVVMAAGDTFRAAAADQLELWSDRVGASVIRGKEGGDPGAVVFDAVQHATARGADLVLADTAGRLHTKTNLMEELKKVRRVAERPPGSVTEMILVIDATTGQNGLVQARQFADAVGVTGVVLTKLDGTAKGGIVVAIRSELGIPIKLVGLGEGPADLVDFDAEEFVEALFGAD